jgi:sulfide:quinone oxidoreductase
VARIPGDADGAPAAAAETRTVAETHVPASYLGTHVLVAGGGVAALECAFALRALAGDLVDLEIVTPDPRFFYRPQAVFEPFGGARVEAFELAELAAALGAQLTFGAVASVVPSAHVARTTQGMAIPYDVLVLASGATPTGIVRDALTFRGPADADRVAEIVRGAGRGEIEQLTLAVPTRRTWPLPVYELALGLRSITDRPIAIATVEPAAGDVLGRLGSSYLTAILAGRSIRLATDVDFRDFASPVTIAAPELRGARIFGIPADEDGFVPTDHFGAVVGVKDVYAAGDLTSGDVKHGSLAAGQADAVAEKIAASAGAALTPTPFRPVLRALIAAGSDSVYVRRDLANPHDPGMVSPEPLWSPPAKIFARHLAPALAAIARQHRRSLFSAT